MGNNNQLVINENCYVGPNCSFWLEGTDLTIIIGKNTTFTHSCHFCCQEHNVSIVVGDDNMFSNNIIVRNSDSHPIYNNENQRINNPKSIIIGDHVWIAPHTIIMKGSTINSGCIIGSYTMVNKEIPDNSLAVGMPSKVVKSDVHWTREELWNY